MKATNMSKYEMSIYVIIYNIIYERENDVLNNLKRKMIGEETYKCLRLK